MSYRYEKTAFGKRWKGGFYCADTREIFLVERSDDALVVINLNEGKLLAEKGGV